MKHSIKRSSFLLLALSLLAAATVFAAPTTQPQAPEIPEWMKDGSTPPAPPSIPDELEAFANTPSRTPTATRTVPSRPGGQPPSLPPGLKAPSLPPSLRAASKAETTTKSNSHDMKITGLAAEGMDLNSSVGKVEFADMSVNEILDMLQNFTGKPILRQSTVAGSLSFHSQGALTRQQAIEAIVSLLALNGVAVTPLGSTYLKAVPATSAANHSPILIEGSTLEYTPSQEVCSKLFRLDYIAVAEAVPALNSQQSGLVGTSITAFEKNLSILATDSLVNLQRMETLLSRIDKPSHSSDKMIFFSLRNISASDAQKRCQQLLTGSMAERFKGNTTVDADDRTNQLIVYTHPSNEELIRTLINNLDGDVEPLTRTQMFGIRHADASDVCDIIKEVVTGQEQARDSTTGSGKINTQRAQQTAQMSASEGAGAQFSEHMTIVPDERTNTIVATGTPTDLRLMGEMIEQLDALLPQVRIEVVITEVTLSEGEASGLNEFGIRYGSTAPDSALKTGDVAAGDGLGGGNKDVWITPTFQSVNGISPLSVSSISLENFSIDAVFRVAKTNSNVQVLSAPNIVTTHNREASIIVGSREPVVTTAVTRTTSDNDVVANIDYQDIALELTVKPLIGSNGVIQMEITQKVNEVISRVTLAGLGEQPVIGTRQASSFVSVANGKMVVLGGLQKVNDEKNNNKVFLLGDIPLLGRLFRPSSTTVKRTELLIFIRPVILSNPAEAQDDAHKKISELRSHARIESYLKTGSFDQEDEKTDDSDE